MKEVFYCLTVCKMLTGMINQQAHLGKNSKDQIYFQGLAEFLSSDSTLFSKQAGV